MTRFWNNLDQVAEKPIYLKGYYLKAFGSKKTKRLKSNSQNRLRSHMPEVLIIITVYFCKLNISNKPYQCRGCIVNLPHSKPSLVLQDHLTESVTRFSSQNGALRRNYCRI